ncbi:MAG TPA: GDP-L-fucose synthase [Pyrinomonadaceae bacterium]|nr:GDP-L-fucose synthase [Pyrinomonadaceae bacterium]
MKTSEQQVDPAIGLGRGNGFWARKRVCITGGAGFLGTHVVKRLIEAGCESVFVPRSSVYDLRDGEAVKRLYSDARPEVVIHLAAAVGGIGKNWLYPGTFFYDNLIMGTQLLHEAHNHGVSKFVTVGTICSYPKEPRVPFCEDDLWDGYPEETTAPYGMAKKALLVQGQAYRKEYAFNSIHLLAANLYGPFDNFDPQTSHVLPALVKKCVDAKYANASFVDVWGSGQATREFLHVDDCARAVLLATEQYELDEPVNLGSGIETSIKSLVTLIAELVGFQGEIRWDPSKPDGQPRRCLDVTRAKEAFGFRAEVDFVQGVKQTIDWYLTQLKHDLN